MRNSQVRWRVVAIGGFVLLCATGAYVRWTQRVPLPVPEVQPEVQIQSSNASEQNSVTSVAVIKPKVPPLVVPILPKATLHSRQIVNAVAGVGRPARPLTREEALQWKTNVDQLIQLGPDGVAAIAEFIQTKQDVVFDRDAAQFLDFGSARELLFAVLARMGGTEALAVTRQALQNSSNPREIAQLAQNLDMLAPETYRQESVAAARNLLAQGEAGKLAAGVDVAALFEVVQQYGGAEVVPDLERMSHKWEYYSAIALAGLPEGAGIPALLDIAQRNGSAATMALQLLAQISTDQSRAGLALMGQVQADKIPPEAWPFLVPALAGNQFLFRNSGFTGPEGMTHPGNISTAHVSSGNQTFYNAFIPLTQEAINQRLAFIDQLRGVSSQPAALQALQQAGDLLRNRVPNITASIP